MRCSDGVCEVIVHTCRQHSRPRRDRAGRQWSRAGRAVRPALGLQAARARTGTPTRPKTRPSSSRSPLLPPPLLLSRCPAAALPQNPIGCSAAALLLPCYKTLLGVLLLPCCCPTTHPYCLLYCYPTAVLLLPCCYAAAAQLPPAAS